MTVQRGKTSEDVEEVTKVEDDEVEPCALVVLSEAGKDVAAVICPFVDADGITGVEEKAEDELASESTGIFARFQ